MAGIRVVGMDKLEKQLKKNVTLNDVKKVVRKNGVGLQKATQKKAPVDTGTLKRSIGIDITDSGMTATVEPTAEYSAYVEYGTRFMKAQPYMKPALEEQEKLFKADMQKLVK